MTADWLLVAATTALAVIFTAWAVYATRPSREAAREDQTRHIRIKGRYQPSEVHVRAGTPTRLIFRREETTPCSERVVFPDFGISVTLPPFEDVAVDLPASEPGQHEFTCQMQMLRGTVIVDRDGVER